MNILKVSLSSVGEEIEDITEHAAFGPVYFGVLTASACNGGEFLVLDVEYLRPEASCSTEFTDIITGIRTFRTFVIERLHPETSCVCILSFRKITLRGQIIFKGFFSRWGPPLREADYFLFDCIF